LPGPLNCVISATLEIESPSPIVWIAFLTSGSALPKKLPMPSCSLVLTRHPTSSAHPWRSTEEWPPT